jgi:raffinose/stachyose/melibiose transport system substrate-binding protein
MKRVLVWLIVFTFMASVLFIGTGCKPAAVVSTTETAAADTTTAVATTAGETAAVETTASAEPVKLVFIFQGGDPEEELYKKLVTENFTAKYPNITVEFQTIPYETFIQGLMPLVSGGSQIDVILSNLNAYRDLVDKGVCADLTDVVTYWKDRFIWNPMATAFYQIDNKLYSLPVEIPYTSGIFVNKKLFDKYNLTYPVTYQDFVNAGAVFNKNGIVPIAIDGKEAGYHTWYMNFCWDQVTGGKANENLIKILKGEKKFSDQDVVDAVNLWVQFGKDGLFEKNFGSVTWDGASALFVGGKAAAIIDGNWDTSLYKDAAAQNPDLIELDYIPFPIVVNGATPAYVGGPGQSLIMYSKTKYPDEALKLMDFLTTDDVALQVAKDANSPISPNAGVAAPGDALDNKIVDSMKNTINFTGNFQPQDIESLMCDKIAAIFAGSITTQDALNELQQAFQKKLDEGYIFK